MARARISGIAIDCPDAKGLATFYSQLLDIGLSSPDAFILAGEGDDQVEVWFQEVAQYQPPTWPTQERGQQLHFDVEVDDRPAMIQRAVALGATLADPNPGGSFTVMLDPAGHPFCLCDRGE